MWGVTDWMTGGRRFAILWGVGFAINLAVGMLTTWPGPWGSALAVAIPSGFGSALIGLIALWFGRDREDGGLPAAIILVALLSIAGAFGA